MLTPRYYFTGEFCRFYDYFLSHPHTEKHFAKGEYLWRPGQPHEKNSLHKKRRADALRRPRKRPPQNHQLPRRRQYFPGYIPAALK